MDNIEIIRLKRLLNSETKRRRGSLKRYWGHQDPTTRRQRECQNNKRCNEKNDNFARASHVFVHFFAVFARLRLENAQFRAFYGECKQVTSKSYFSPETWLCS